MVADFYSVEDFNWFMGVFRVRGINMVRISTSKGEKIFKELTDLVGLADAVGLALLAEFRE